MVFQAGEIYLNKKTGRHIYVIFEYHETTQSITLDIQEVDPDSMQLLFHNVLTVEKTNLLDWEHVELV